MASVSSSSGAVQYGWQQLKLQQARRTADQAEQQAQALAAQAGDAQRTADREQDNARNLSVQSEQAQAAAGQARRGVAAISTQQQGISQLSSTIDQVLGRQQAKVATPPPGISSPPVSVGKAKAPVINTQGQVTGKIINTTA